MLDAHEDVVGRDDELARIRDFVASPFEGPAALVIDGDAGIGETTLWRHGVRLLEGAGVPS